MNGSSLLALRCLPIVFNFVQLKRLMFLSQSSQQLSSSPSRAVFLACGMYFFIVISCYVLLTYSCFYGVADRSRIINVIVAELYNLFYQGLYHTFN